MRLTCENCGAPVGARNVNVQTMTAVCEACDAVFQFDPTMLSKTKLKREKIEKPDTFDVTDADEAVTIDYVWRRNMGSVEIAVLVVCLMGALLLTPISVGLLLDPGDSGTLIGAGLLAVMALGCLYMLAMLAVNRTRIHLDAEGLNVRHYPLYWRGLAVPISDIESFSLRQPENLENYRDLRINTHDGRSRTIDMLQVSHGQYLHHQLGHTFSVITEGEDSGDDRAIDRLLDRLDEIRISEEGELILPDEEADSQR